MDQNTTSDYIAKLPKPLQDFVFSGVWEERTLEIAKKYSLSDPQTETLINNVLFVLIGIDDANTFLTSITSELGISKLLIEQILEDLEMRVFEYASKSINKKTEKALVPEIAPNMLPVIDRTHAPEYRPKSKPVSASVIPPIPVPKPKVISAPIPTPQVAFVGGELVQNPIPVPRFIASKDDEGAEPVPQTTTSTTKTPVSSTPLVKNYVADPYREPIE